MDAPRRPRLVRRVPLITRIANAPGDYLMTLQSRFHALDWDKLQEAISWPLALGLNGLLISVKLGYWLDDPMANIPAVLKDDRVYYSSSSLLPGFATVLTYLQHLLLLISFLNAIWLFRSKKNYAMHYRDIGERPTTANVRLVDFQQDESHWSCRIPGKWLYPLVAPFIRSPTALFDKRQVWEMSLWNPSILSRNLFCWYSPAQVLIMAGMDGDNFHIFLPISIVVAIQVYILVSVYQSYVKDKQTLFGEVYREYDAKFVNPRIFVRKLDKGVSTETDFNDMDQGKSSWEPMPSRHGAAAVRRPMTGKNPLYSPTATISTGTSPISSRSSASSNRGSSESEGSEESEGSDEDEIEEDEEEDEDEEEESEDEDDGVPRIPHPTNSLPDDYED